MSRIANQYLEDLIGGVYSTVKIARDTLMVSNDSYHLLHAIKQYGEQEVVITMAQIIADEEGISFVNASARASNFIQGVLQASAGGGYGRRVRRILN